MTDLARIGYLAFCERASVTPKWDECSPLHRDCWIEAATAIEKATQINSSTPAKGKSHMSIATASPDEPNPPTRIHTLLAAHPYDRIADIGGFITTMGAAIHESGFFGCVNAAQGKVIALNCLVNKIPPLEQAATDHIIKGKLSMRADAMLARFQARGGSVKWIKQGDDGLVASAKWSTKDGPSIEIQYTIEDAKRAGLLGKDNSNWSKDPSSMLRARLISKAVRMLDPACVAGRYTPEELDSDSAGSVDENEYVPVKNTEGHQAVALPGVTHPPVGGPANADLGGLAESKIFQQVAPNILPGQKTLPLPAADAPPAVAANVPLPTTAATGSPSLDASEPPVSDTQLREIKSLKDQLQIPQDKWLHILSKQEYATGSAKNLSERKAQKLIDGMRKKVADRELSDWANKALPGGAGGPVAGGCAEQPPFALSSPGQSG